MVCSRRYRTGLLVITDEIRQPALVRNACAALALACTNVTVLLPKDLTPPQHGHSNLTFMHVPPVPGAAHVSLQSVHPRQIVVPQTTIQAVRAISELDQAVRRLREGHRVTGRPAGAEPAGAGIHDNGPRVVDVDTTRTAGLGPFYASEAQLVRGQSGKASVQTDQSAVSRRGRNADVPFELELLDINFGAAVERQKPELVMALDTGALVVCTHLRRRAGMTFRLAFVHAQRIVRFAAVADRLAADVDVVIDATALTLPLRLRSRKAGAHDVRRKAEIADGAPFAICHLGSRSPLVQVTALVEVLRARPDLYAVVLGQDLGDDLRQVRLACRDAGQDGRLRPVKAPDPDLLPNFLAGATAGIQFGPEETGEIPSTLAALATIGVPVIVPRTSAMVPLVADGLAGVVVDDATPAALLAGLADVERLASSDAPPVPAQLRWEDQVRRAAASLVGRSDEPSNPTPRLLIGPRNGNAQAAAWTRAVRAAAPELEADSFAAEYATVVPTAAEVDDLVPLASWKANDWQLVWSRVAMARYSHVLLEQALTLTGTLNGRRFFEDLDTLREHGLVVGLVFRGSEVRNPARHAEREPWSPFSDPEDPLTAKLQAAVDEIAPQIAAFDGARHVTTLDLLDDVPGARWLPQVIDLEQWHPGPPVLAGRKPVVLHIPSNEKLKGSSTVDAICSDLANAGYIEYLRPTRVPYENMPETIRSADVVLDQFALGSYGVLALQAMACERTVIGHVASRVRDRLDGDLPIVQATSVDLADVLMGLIADRDRARHVAGAGRAYIERFHDGRHSADVLLDFVGWSTARRGGDASPLAHARSRQ